jgi:large repetitive protein
MPRLRLLPALLLLLFVVLPAAGCSRRAASIEVSPKKVKIYGLDKPQRLTARLLDKKNQPLEIGTANWESTNPAVATVDGGGLVTPKSEGQTKIVAKYDKVRTEVPLEVVDVKSLEVVPTTALLVGPAGVQVPLQATVKNSKDKKISLVPMWSSSNPEVATVSADGVVTSVAKGTATLAAKIGDVQGACEVTVDVRNLSRIEIRPLTALVRVGDSQKFQVIAYDAEGKTIEGPAARFASSDPSVATVSAGGGASGVKAGAAIVKASIGTLTTEATLIVN